MNLIGAWSSRYPTVWFVQQRLTNLFVALLLLTILVFLMLELVPGDPATAAAGLNATPEYVRAVKAQLGLDRPLPERFLGYLSSLTRGDLGTSFFNGEPVAELIGMRIGYTMRLASAALAIAMVVAVPAGVLTGALTRDGQRPRLESLTGMVSGFFQAVPHFVFAAFLVLFFAVQLNWFHPSGANTATSIVLPAIALSLAPGAALTRLVRLEVLTVLGQDYVRTARSQRLSSGRIYARHVLPNAAAPVISLAGLVYASLLGGSVVIEKMFAWPGLGQALVDAIEHRDYPAVQGIMLTLGVIILTVNTGIDLLLSKADHRSLIKES